jgi:hypothetical protein
MRDGRPTKPEIALLRYLAGDASATDPACLQLMIQAA